MKLTKNYEKLEKSAVKLTVTIDKADIEATYKKVTANYTKNAQIPGFRKGHVPAKVLETKYGDALKADTMSEAIDASLNEIFSDENEKENTGLIISPNSLRIEMMRRQRSSDKERRVDARALIADEGRDKLRKASGSRKWALIRRYPNGGTRLG